MSEYTPKYFALLTDAGSDLEARALAAGRGIVLTHIAVGDANKEYAAPVPEATALVHEVWRKEIDSKSVSADDPNITLLRAVIPATEGGFWIRELGVYGHVEGEEGETLYAYANHAPYYKMLPADGQTVTHEIVIPVTTSSAASVIIKVNELGYATKSEFDSLKDWLAENLPGNGSFLDLAANVIRATNRITRLELEKAGECPGCAQPLGPEGYRLGDAIVAPVTLVKKGAEPPSGAALVLEQEEIEPNNHSTI